MDQQSTRWGAEGVMMFDEQPDGDPHGECAAEIHRLNELVKNLERQVSILYIERDHARNGRDQAVRITASIYGTIYPELMPVDGKGKMRFMPPNPHDYMQRLSDQIRAIPEELSAEPPSFHTFAAQKI